MRSGTTYLAQTVNTYAAAGGPLTFSSVKNWVGGNDANAADTSMTYTVAWYDGARTASSTYDSDTGSGSNQLFTSSYVYDGLGRTTKVTIQDGRPRTVSFAESLDGQVLNRKERSAASANPEDRHYFLGAVQWGELTSNGKDDPERLAGTRNSVSPVLPHPFTWRSGWLWL